MAYGDKAMKKTAMCKWYARFLDGQESIRDEKHSPRPKIVTSNHVTMIKDLLDNELACAVQGAISKINGDSYFNSFLSWIHCCLRYIFFSRRVF